MAEKQDTHAGDPMVEPHGTADDHGGEALGPIDVAAWGAAVLGVALGLIVLIALILAVG